MIRIQRPVITEQDSYTQVATTITVGEKAYPVWYRVPAGPVSDGMETFLVASVVPAMQVGYAIEVPGPVSSQLLDGIQRAQQQLIAWYPQLKQVPVHTTTKTENTKPMTGAGTFFSCGVDACFTLLSHFDEVQAAVLIHGFDYQNRDKLISNTVSHVAQQAMRRFQKPLLEVETNIREFGDHYADWGTMYHGSVLASVGLLLTPRLGKMYIASSYHQDDLFPWGSHPNLDSCWSTEAFELVHDGCPYTRAEKVAKIAESDAALSVLRVCWSAYKKEGTQLNCGKCEKCTRTMIDLRIAGVLERCTTFRRRLDLQHVALTDFRRGKHRSFYQASLKQLKKTGHDPELQSALEDCLSGRRYQGVMGMFRDTSNFMNRRVIRPLMRPVERAVQRMVRKG